ncbi:MAG TPA: hypothetical protein DCL44_04125 [Elusimicrobia bacterium]|nr:hypothetical protein [Elusimicrobiota bacterium]
MIHIFASLFFLISAFSRAAEPSNPPGGAQAAGGTEAQSTDPLAAQLREYYDKAFGFYTTGDYQKAIEYWNMVLRADSKQVTARNMIEDARHKMAGSSMEMKGAFYELIKKGLYADALVKMESMLATDPTNQGYQKLQTRTRTVSAIAPKKPSSTKSWNIATDGLYSWLGEKEDALFAYDALRYAFELSPAESRFQRMIAALEQEFPQLKINDTKPPNVSVLENKKDVALHHIYDSKFYPAVKELEGALRLEPGDITTLKRLGSAYLQLKDYPKARTAWQKAAALAPKDSQLTEYLAALDKAAPPGKSRQNVAKTKKRKLSDSQ